MGTKTAVLFLSWVLTVINIQFMPIDWWVWELVIVKNLCYGACSGYSIWLLWDEQDYILSVLDAVWFIWWSSIKKWWEDVYTSS